VTPQERERNIFRARRITAAIAGIAVAACGLFAGLATSATKHTAKATTTTATTRRTTTTQAAPTTTIAPVVVTPAQSPPVASSGGS